MSTGHPVAFRRAGIAQKEKSWYILLFQFTGIAEEWIRQNDFENLRTVTRHPEIDEVIGRFTDPAALTGSLNLYRAMTPPGEQHRARPDAAAHRSADPGHVEHPRHRPGRGRNDRLGGTRARAVALRTRRGRRSLATTRRTGPGQRGLLDFLRGLTG